ncbi:nicotinate phosphoribosyltransferase [Raphidocelis subcapitata]|uniref:Nicotinamide phosphoribosyltransferase n=1 Tax=Raphidocelis subcapitata TaxID=307507 RepID=A0A2V0P564_9CHLO|nr:nicotinate phosphoribosyltransferase [Raphidocelis subcapitata]|eukprot:GBF95014.1 nicotinate phosphoribosyltransferase [Raphidocelis subcapitata]
MAAPPLAPAGLPGGMLDVVPITVLTDSYKASHFLQYPDPTKMVAYGEFRCGFDRDEEDTRLVWYGIRYIIDHYVARRWTMEDVERADAFYSTHNAGGSPYPFPRDLFAKIVTQHGGHFPVKIQALREGTPVHAHVPVYQITAEGEFAPLCTYLETLLTMAWYPTTVATLSRRARDAIAAAFEDSVEGGAASPLLASRLHDFGFRGCTSVEQSVIGGCAHLLNFEGTDTMSAAYYAQARGAPLFGLSPFHLNGGRPVASSIPATEHSVMTAWPNEAAAISNMVEKFGTGVFACVMDSYDYAAALAEVAAGGYMVLRPDSGDPVEVVLMALRAADSVFGSTVNSKGFKELKGVGVIQGDGINLATIKDILSAVLAEGYSAANVAFGMGGGLLQKVNRDTMSFATKLCHMALRGGGARDVMKHPKTDSSKISLPGVLAVKRVGDVPTVFPADSGEVAPGEDLLEVVYDCGPVPGRSWDDFASVRARLASEWDALPRTADVISGPLRDKIAAVVAAGQGAAAGGRKAGAAAGGG